ncbi:MAG: hypothetical protein GPJ54_12830 [Candidatus Heimdallarchaeota archaeon]|nr:hypothetical protein [Candidatus Heimdallarchaeota archaeon]
MSGVKLPQIFNYNRRLIFLSNLFSLFTYLFFLKSVFMILYLQITLLFLISQHRLAPRKTKSEKVDDLRKYWIYQLIKNKLTDLNLFSHEISYDFSKLLELPLENFYHLEISNPVNNFKFTDQAIPDLLAAEKEILDQEIRTSKILVTIVFIPILFYLFHIIYPISQFSLLLNSVNIILLIENLSFQLRHPHILLGWNDINYLLREIGGSVYHDPYYFIYQLRTYFDDIYLLEISQTPPIKHHLSSHHSLSQIIKIVLNTDQEIRNHVILEFVEATKQVALLELIHIKKWESFRIQFIYVTSSLILFLAILTGIFQIFVRLSSELISETQISIISFQDLPFLSELTIVITLTLIYFLSQLYLNPLDQRKFLFWWALEYIIITQALGLFFKIMFD